MELLKSDKNLFSYCKFHVITALVETFFIFMIFPSYRQLHSFLEHWITVSSVKMFRKAQKHHVQSSYWVQQAKPI